MKFCPNCKTTFDDSANVCPTCGTPLMELPAQVYTQVPSTDHTASFSPADISDNKIIAILPYLTGMIGIIVALLASSSSPYVAFHVRQSLKITVVSLIGILLCIVPILGWIAYGIWSIVAFVINIICIVNVCKGKAIEAPIVSGFKFLK